MPLTPGGGAPAGAPATGGGGAMPLPPHGQTAKGILKMKWDFPTLNIYKRDANADTNTTIAAKVEKALPSEEAYFTIAEDDRRPLLVLRECLSCNGTDDALLSRSESNENTLVVTRWFHCVKLPTDILNEEHPFHALFEGNHPPHLFVSRWDGSNAIPLRGDLSRSELLGNMYTMLKAEYKKDAKKATKEIVKLLYVYDMLDEKIQRLEITIDDELEQRGPKSKKLKKYRSQLEDAKKEMAKTKEKEKKLSDLQLRKPDESPNALEELLKSRQNELPEGN
ncbi:MAG: hypothetical protein QGF46_00570 [Planctomycetota bacterium]|jgi:hypothetical protein|nr:hypothetical protein [Planctomycetota bacterium]